MSDEIVPLMLGIVKDRQILFRDGEYVRGINQYCHKENVIPNNTFDINNYNVGSSIYNEELNKLYFCVDNTEGNAKWVVFSNLEII